MSTAKNTPQITIRSVTPADLPPFREFALDIFSRKSSLWRHVGLNAEQYGPIYDQIERCLDLDTTAIAHLPGGKIIGFFITVPFSATFDHSMVSPGCQAVSGILRSLDNWFLEKVLSKKSYSSKDVLHILANGTADGYEGLGLNRGLRNYAVKKAKEAGWKMLVAESAEAKVQSLMRDVDKFEVGAHMPFDDYVIDGRRPFQGRRGGVIIFYTELVGSNHSSDTRSRL